MNSRILHPSDHCNITIFHLARMQKAQKKCVNKAFSSYHLDKCGTPELGIEHNQKKNSDTRPVQVETTLIISETNSLLEVRCSVGDKGSKKSFYS